MTGGQKSENKKVGVAPKEMRDSEKSILCLKWVSTPPKKNTAVKLIGLISSA